MNREQGFCVADWLGGRARFSFAGGRREFPPKPPGKLVDLGGHKLHVYCSGHGSPTVVVENGLGDFSFDWTLVQNQVSRFARICTYDRAGYAWSDPGPKPRTFAQINLELHDALEKLGERGPYVLVGHSYGGPVMRNFAAQFPRNAAGLVLVDSAVEGMRVGVGGKATIQLGVNVQARDVPPPHEQMTDSDKTPAAAPGDPHPPAPLDPLYKPLPPSPNRNCSFGPRIFPNSKTPKTASASGPINTSPDGWPTPRLRHWAPCLSSC